MTELLRQIKNNPDVVFLELDTDDTSPTKTMGFTDDQIREMRTEDLHAQAKALNTEELQLHNLLTDLKQRRFVLTELLDRKAHI